MMDEQFLTEADGILSIVDTGRFATGRDGLLRMLSGSKDPLGRVFLAYNLAIISWSRIGNGEAARKYFQLAVKEAEGYGVTEVNEVLPSLVANACENLMHLSLSFEEFFTWTEKLRNLQPDDDILRGMVPSYQEAQEKGRPWAESLEELASMSYDRSDPSKDRGEYARAVSIYHLMLLNRKTLRLPREAWSRTIYEYGTLSLRVAVDAMNTMVRTRQSPNTGEFTFIVEDAKPFLEEYLSTNPSDPHVQPLLDDLNGFQRNMGKIEKGSRVATLNKEGNEHLGHRNYSAALACLTEAVEISREIGDENKLQICLGSLALWAMQTGDPQQALGLITEKEALCRKLDQFGSLANALAIKANALYALKKPKEALRFAEEAEQLCVQHNLETTARQLKPLLDKLRSK